MAPQLPEVVSEAELHDSLRDETGRVTPTTITSMEAEIRVSRTKTIKALYDAKPPEVIKAEAELMPLDPWSRVVARLDKEQNIKVAHAITGMGILRLFPLPVKEGE